MTPTIYRVLSTNGSQVRQEQQARSIELVEGDIYFLLSWALSLYGKIFTDPVAAELYDVVMEEVGNLAVKVQEAKERESRDEAPDLTAPYSPW